MSRSTILTRILGVSMVGVLLAGCLALPKSDRTMFQEPLLASKGTLPLKAGLMTLTDARPAGERRSFPDIEDFPDRITLELLMDLSEAQLFSSIGHDSRGADVILRGEIRSFEWKARYDWAAVRPRSRVSRRHRHSRRPFDRPGRARHRRRGREDRSADHLVREGRNRPPPVLGLPISGLHRGQRPGHRQRVPPRRRRAAGGDPRGRRPHRRRRQAVAAAFSRRRRAASRGGRVVASSGCE